MTMDRPLLPARPVRHRAKVVKVETDAQSPAPALRRGLQIANDAHRRGARCRAGRPCGSAAVRNGRGGILGGATPGAPTGPRKGCYRHGRYTIANKAMMAEMRELRRALRALCED